MDIPEFPPNSEASKKGRRDAKDLSPVVSGTAVRRRKTLRKQCKETFVAGDARTAVQYVLFDVLLPSAKDMVVEAASSGIEKLIFGDSRRRGSTRPISGPTGYVNYSRYSSGNMPEYGGSRIPSSQRALSRRARARHDFDEIVLTERAEAEEVIDRLFDLVSRYESASVADLYELVGLGSNHTDNKWGWTDLTGAGVSRIRGGYLLDLPEPEPLD